MSQPSQDQMAGKDQTQAQFEAERYRRLLRNTAIFTLVACPALALLPPRKLDIYTFGLIGATGFSANHLVRERTGRPITAYLSLEPTMTTPAAAMERPTPETQRQVNAHGEINESSLRQKLGHDATGPVTEEIQSQRAAWKVQREKEIKEDVREGKDYGDMIMGQIWEVWNWGRSKNDDDEK